MGYYLNSGDAFELYERETNKPYFIDKTEMLKELFPLVEQKGSNISVTRPRRFGKSVMAAMIGSFFGIEFDKIIKTAPRFNYMRELEKESARISTTE